MCELCELCVGWRGMDGCRRGRGRKGERGKKRGGGRRLSGAGASGEMPHAFSHEQRQIFSLSALGLLGFHAALHRPFKARTPASGGHWNTPRRVFLRRRRPRASGRRFTTSGVTSQTPNLMPRKVVALSGRMGGRRRGGKSPSSFSFLPPLYPAIPITSQHRAPPPLRI